jgi:hypothetical protein
MEPVIETFPGQDDNSKNNHQNHNRLRDGDRTARDRPFLLDWMLAISLLVRDVINDVDCTGDKRKDYEGKDGGLEVLGAKEMLGKNQWRNEKRVLDPLLWS